MNGDTFFRENELCGATEVGKILGIGEGGVRRIIKDRRIPGIIIARNWIFLRSDVEEYKKLREEKAAKGDKRIRSNKKATSDEKHNNEKGLKNQKQQG